MHYSIYSYRIKPIYTHDSSYTWIFLPSGPGLGSAYLEPLCRNLNLPGTSVLVDFPKDGTNEEGILNFIFWKKGLIDLVSQYKNPILVTHSFSGMFVLNTPELQPYLKGLVLMNTTTRNTFFTHMTNMQLQHQLPDLVPAAADYHLAPSTHTYRAFWHVYKQYCCTAEELSEGETMISQFAFNHYPYEYAVRNFYAEYRYSWSPDIPTLTIASENDFICPPTIFTQDLAFQKANILNKIIPKAGHCPWLLYLADTKLCFNEYLKNRIT